MTDELADLARRLMVARPEDFVAARTAAARESRSRDRALATRIGALRKPPPAAWVVLLLAAQGALDDAVALGPSLRAAQASAEPGLIARLRRERRTLVAALVDAGADLAAEHGHPLTDAVRAQVAGTIEAAMSDAAAGVAVRSGLLVRPLEAVGFGSVDLAGALAVPEAVSLPDPADPDPAEADPVDAAADGADRSRPSSPDRASPDRAGADRAARRERARTAARAERDATRAAAQTADATLAELDARADAAEARRRELEDRRHDLERELREVRRAVTDAVRDAEWVAGERAAADRAAEDAHAALDRDGPAPHPGVGRARTTDRGVRRRLRGG